MRTLSILSLSTAIMLTTACGQVRSSLKSNSSEVLACERDPDLPGCIKLRQKGYKLEGNPASVSIPSSKRLTLLSASTGDLEGIFVTMPKGGFEGKLEFKATLSGGLSSGLGLVDWAKKQFGIADETLWKDLTLEGSTRLISPITVTLPYHLTKNLADSRESLFEISFTSASGVKSTIKKPAIKIKTIEGKKQVSFELSEWGKITPMLDFAPPVLTSETAIASPNASSSISIVVKASEPLSNFSSSVITVTNGSVTGFSASGLDYTITITPAATGEVRVQIPKANIKDIFGNTSAADFVRTFISDKVSPSVVISSSSNTVTNTSPIPVTITFSEAVTGFDAGDLVAVGGTLGTVSGSGTTYTVDFTPTSQGDVTLDLAAGRAQDLAGNQNTAAVQFARTFDSVAPSVVLSSTALATTNVSPIPVTVTFSESVTGVTLGDFIISNGVASNLTGSAATYTFDVTPAGLGTVTVDLASGMATDAAGNGNTAASQLSRVYNNVNPSVILSTGAGTHSTTAAITVTATFSSSVTGFVIGDITPTNAVVSGFSGSGTTYTFTLTASSQGAFSAAVNAGVAQDASLNPNTASNTLTVIFDNVAPTVMISSTSSATTNVTPIPITITFSESVTGFVVGDITVTGGTAGAFSGSGSTYTADITPSGQGVININVAGSAAQDAAGNNNTAATQLSRTFDSLAPTVTISSAATPTTTTSPIPVTITFSESVTGFVVGDITVSNGTAGNFSGSGTTYTADITPTADGTVTVDVAGSVAIDAGSNNNSAASQLTRIYDGSAPVPGSSGTITPSAVGATAMTLSWVKATDSVTPQASLEYEVRRSLSNNMASVANAESNGTVVQAYATDINTASVTGLTVSTSYFFTVIVRDGAGRKAVYTTVNQATTADTTAPTPGNSGTITVPAPSITATGFTLQWTAATDNVTAGASLQYFVCSGINAAAIDTDSECVAATQEMNWTANTTQLVISGKSPSTAYYYNVIVRDAASNQASYTGVTATTAADTTAPTPGTFSASTGVGNTGFTLNWSAASDNVTAASSLEYRVCSGANAAAIDTVAECDAATTELAYTANTLTLAITGKLANTTYFYNVVVRDAAGNKSFYNGLTQATTADVTNPSAGTFSSSTSVGAVAFTLNWASASDNATPTASIQYRVCSGASIAAIDTVSECDAATTVMNYTANTLTFTHTGRTPSTTYYYNVIARDLANNKVIYEGLTQATTADTTAPTPGNSGTMTASSITATGMTLGWTAGSDDVTAGTSLQYYVCTGASLAAIDTVAECEAATMVANWTTNSVSRAVSSLSPSTTYFYNVVVRDAALNKSIYAGITQATTAETTPPTAGTFSTSPITGTTSVTLAWTAATDNVTAATSLEYYTCRATSDADIDSVVECEAATQVMNWSTNALTTTASSLVSNTTYFFRTIVRDAAGNKALYPSKSETTLNGFTTTTNGERDSSSQHTFYDSINDRHWVFYIDGSDLKCRYSADNVTWTTGTAMTAPATKFSMHYKSVSGTPYVFMVSEENSFDVVLRRGSLTSSSVTFDSPVTVFDGTSATDLYTSPAVVTDDTNVWVAASRFTGSWQAVVRESTNGAGGVLSAWETTANLGSLSSNPKAITLLPKGGEDLYAIYKDGEAIIGYTLISGSWSSAHTGGDLAWLTLAGSNGVLNGQINAAVWYQGSLYIGGGFTQAGGVSANYIARWNGTSWSALGSGMNYWVSALAVSGSDLYAGGLFTTAGGASANYIARWNGTSWSALGSGANNTVTTLVISGSDLYVGGGFTSAGGVSANRVARWNGSSWSALGAGLNSSVYALAAMGTDIYVGGQFSTAGGVSAGYVARWNGTSWSALGSGVNNVVNSLAVSGSDLYVGGQFTTAGGVSASRVARWDGTSWTALGSGVNNEVYALAVSGSDLYVGGTFTLAGGASANRIARWNGTSWSALSSGVNNSVIALAVSGSDLYVGGSFTTAGGVSANNIARWNGTSLSALGSGINGTVTAMAVSGSDVYMGGSFTTIGGTSANGISRWNGTSWSALGSGVNGTVTALAVSGSDLYVGGSFSEAGGVPASNIARWNGTSWSALGSGTNNWVFAFAVSGSDLYAGGWFTTAGGLSANYIARWDGTSWSALGSGTNQLIKALAILGSDLYVGGNFSTAGGVSANQIARWNGTSWSALGSGVNNTLEALAVSGSDLYAGGFFTTAGGVSAYYVARWNGTSWSALGSGLSNSVETLAVSGSNLYVGGNFTEAGGIPAKNVARWNGTSWNAPGVGVGGTVVSLSVLAGQVFSGYDNGVSVLDTAVANTLNPISAAVNNSGDLTLAYIDTAGLVKAKSFSSSTWSAATNIQSTGASFAPQISSVPGTNQHVAFWYRGGAFEYKRFNGTTWDASPTTLIPASLNSRFASCDPFAGDSIIKCIVTSQSFSPVDITTWTMTP